MKRILYGVGFWCLLHGVPALAWNALGHQLVAQIAYDHLSTHARKVCNQYNQAMDKVYKPQSFTNAAVWLDTLRYQGINWFSTMHYVDLPFSPDGSEEPLPPEINAVWAIEKSRTTLLNKYATDFDKGVALRVILHVVGDLHQPLHASTCVSADFPQGDRGGNLMRLQKNPIGKNLHSYWDKGGGFLLNKRKSPIELKTKAAMIEA